MCNKKLQPYGAGAWHYLRRLVFLRAFALGVTLTVIVTGTVTLRVVREGLFFFFVAIGIYLLVIKIVLRVRFVFGTCSLCVRVRWCSYFLYKLLALIKKMLYLCTAKAKCFCLAERFGRLVKRGHYQSS